MMMSLRDRKALSESKSASLMEFETKGTSEAEDDEKKLPELSNYEEERKVKRNKADEEMAKETEQKASGRMVTRSRVRNLVNKKDSSKRENEESSDKSDQSDKTDKVSSNKRVLESMDEDKDSQEEVSSPESPLAKKSKKKNEEIIVDLDEERNVSKGPLVKVKRVIKGSNEGEIRVVTSFERLKDLEQSKSDGMEKPIPSPDKIYRTYGGPRANLSEKYLSSKTVGRKYMILDKATIKEMMDKGLIQTIQKGDGSQSIASYRAVIPRSGGSSIFHQVASPVANIPVTTSTTFKTGFATSGQTMVTPSVIMTSSSVGTPVAVATSVGGIPVSGNVYRTATINPGGTSVATNASQIVTAPIYIRPHVSSAGLPITTVTTQQGDVQVVALPPDLMKQIHQIQQKGTLTDSQGSPSTFKTSTINQEIGIPRGDILTKDSENANFVHEAGEVKNDIAANTKKEMAYGVPTGVCKVLKSMKMYQYVDEKRPLVVSGANGPIKSAVRWVAVPNSSEGATFQIAGPIDKTAGGASFQPLGSPVLKTSVPLEVNVSVAKKEADANLPQIEMPNESQETRGEMYLHHKILELRAKQKEQLSFHRKRYSELLHTYNELAGKYNEIKDVGTMKQILLDAKKFMKKEHLFFFRNEMLLRDRGGTGNRYSSKFMNLLLKYYNSSHIGYRFLRHIFTLPAVRTLLAWQSKRLQMKKKNDKSRDFLEITINNATNQQKGYSYAVAELNGPDGESIPAGLTLNTAHRNSMGDSDIEGRTDSDTESADNDSYVTNSSMRKEDQKCGVPEMVIELDEK